MNLVHKIDFESTFTPFLRKFLFVAISITFLFAVLFAILFYVKIHSEQLIFKLRDTDVILKQFRNIEKNFQHISADLKLVAGHYALKVYLKNQTKQNYYHLIQDYSNIIEHLGHYDQLRYINAQGMEVIRINNDKNHSQIIAKEELQNKSNRYYFRDSMQLPIGQIYVSPFDLNVENGIIEQPLKPMIRFAMPISGPNGKKRGVIILNYLAEELIQDFLNADNLTPAHINLVNADGYWLIAPEAEKEWGFMFKDRQEHKYQNQYKNVWERISKEDRGQFITSEGLFTFSTVFPVLESNLAHFHNNDHPEIRKDYFWKIIFWLPSSIYYQKGYELLLDFLWIYLLTLVLAGIATWMIVQAYVHQNMAKEAMLQSENSLRTVLETVAEGILVMNPKGEILFANQELWEIFGYLEEELIGKKAAFLIDHQDQKAFLQSLSNPELTSKNWSECYGLHKNKTPFPIAFRTAISNMDSKIFTTVIRNLTESKKAEALILEAKQKAEKANQAKSDFLADVSHELRSPLHGIISFSHKGIVKINQPKEKLLHYFDIIHGSGNRLLGLINNLLNLSKLELGRDELNYKSCDFAQCIHRGISDFEIMLEDKRINLKFQHPEGPAILTGDQGKIGQVIRNLLSNSIKFTPPEKNISIDLKKIQLKESEAWQFSIYDEGMGIAEEDLNRVFDKFVRAAQPTEIQGTGLGLSISKKIVELHGGMIWAMPNPQGQGCLFRFYIPIVAEQSLSDRQ